MAAPETLLRNRLKTILETEFAPDGLVVYHDRITAAQATTKHVAGVFPTTTAQRDTDAHTLAINAVVQVYRRWNPEIDPLQKVDPTLIEDWAERFRVAVKNQSHVNDPGCWYLMVDRIIYPPDPTGNITRFHAEVVAYGNNSAAI